MKSGQLAVYDEALGERKPFHGEVASDMDVNCSLDARNGQGWHDRGPEHVTPGDHFGHERLGA